MAQLVSECDAMEEFIPEGWVWIFILSKYSLTFPHLSIRTPSYYADVPFERCVTSVVPRGIIDSLYSFILSTPLDMGTYLLRRRHK